MAVSLPLCHVILGLFYHSPRQLGRAEEKTPLCISGSVSGRILRSAVLAAASAAGTAAVIFQTFFTGRFAKLQRLDIQLQQVTVDEIQAQAVIFRLQASFGHMDFALMRNEILGVDDVADDESEPYRDLTVRNAEV